MQKEICQHGHDITNKRGIACPEGCLSNDQRGIENRQLASWLAEAKEQLRHAVNPQTVVDILNHALSVDHRAMQGLFEVRIQCTEALANHPTIQVATENVDDPAMRHSVGLLGILNGLFGVDSKGYGPISCVFSTEDKHIYRFEVRQGWVPCVPIGSVAPYVSMNLQLPKESRFWDPEFGQSMEQLSQDMGDS